MMRVEMIHHKNTKQWQHAFTLDGHSNVVHAMRSRKSSNRHFTNRRLLENGDQYRCRSTGEIESVTGLSPAIDAAVDQALGHCLTDTELGVGKKYHVCNHYKGHE